MSTQSPVGVAASTSLSVADKQNKFLLWQIWKARWCYLFMAPGIILTAMFTFYPIFYSWYLSLHQYAGFKTPPYYIGFSHYQDVIDDSFFWDAFKHSFMFMGVSVPIKLTLALFIAIVLNDKALRLAPIFRTLFFIPVVTTTAIVGIVMTFILSPFNGPINTILVDLGFISRPIDFLGQPDSALWTVVAIEIWKWLGNPMIYWLAALQTVPPSLYEAARVDGAGWWRQFLYITIPMIRPFALVIVLLIAVQTLNVFALVQTMTGGGPYFASEVMEVYIYRTAFGSSTSMTLPRLGYASAAAVVFGITVMSLVVLQGIAVRRAGQFRREITPAEGK